MDANMSPRFPHTPTPLHHRRARRPEAMVSAKPPATTTLTPRRTPTPTPTPSRSAIAAKTASSSAAAAQARPTLEDRYILGDTLGNGGYAKVKLAVDRASGRQVAVKIVHKRRVPQNYLEKFLPREISTMKTLNHANVTRLLEVYENSECTVLVLEYASRGDMLEYINKRGRLPEAEARAMLAQIVAGVSYCHRKRVIHRDLKCENILLGENLEIKVSDFGFATAVPARDSSLSHTHCGSFAYAAPEILAGEAYNGYQTDVWSMGIILYAMVCGHLPYNDNAPKVLLAQLQQPMEFAPDLSQECQDLLKGMLHLQAQSRLTLEEVLRHPWMQQSAAEPAAAVAHPAQTATDSAQPQAAIIMLQTEDPALSMAAPSASQLWSSSMATVDDNSRTEECGDVEPASPGCCQPLGSGSPPRRRRRATYPLAGPLDF
eukprot:m.35904 g.35904  ORF g.35904 m.35904 type:complete len:432 (+) comp11350_c0_seq1:518-1813(+)